MEKQVKLLDCTLRDGGYINDWNFGHSVITGTYKRLDAAGIEYIEVGFLDDRRPFDINRTIAPNTDCFNEIFKNVEKKQAIPVAMIDFGTCSLDNIGDCSSTFIDGIRVIFKKEKINEALPFCRAIKEKGYQLFIQAISITSYSDMEMLEYVQMINEIKPYAFSIVDTYGLLDNKHLTHYFNLIDNNLDLSIKVGYHAHNNFQLAFSNSVNFVALDTKRELVADCTVYGMGKSAGNCPNELIAMHMNKQYNKTYDLSQILEILDTELMHIYKENYWGYKYNFYISAMNNCHPSYVQYLLDKKTLTITAINEILENIPKDKKLLYDEKYIEDAYLYYQYNAIDDLEAIKELSDKFKNKKILMLGPGTSISKYEKKIKSFINEENPIVITINFKPSSYVCDYVFISNSKRYGKLVNKLGNKKLDAKLIVTSNITTFEIEPDYRLNYQSLLQNEFYAYDNSMTLFLVALIKLRINKVFLAGFDGYDAGKQDYYDVSYSFGSSEHNKIKSNKKNIAALKKLKEQIEIEFLTESAYQKGLV